MANESAVAALMGWSAATADQVASRGDDLDGCAEDDMTAKRVREADHVLSA